MVKYNGSVCIAPGCKSGYKSEKGKEKVHCFSVPAGEDLLEKWQKAILRKDFIIRSGQVVCEKHFRPEDILWKREVKDANGEVMSFVNYKIPRLRKGALPSVFPNCPKYLSKVGKGRKPPMKRKTLPTNKSTQRDDPLIVKVEHEMDVAVDGTENCEVFTEECSSFTSSMQNLSFNTKSTPSTSKSQENESAPSDENAELSETEKFDLFNSLIASKSSFFNLPIAWSRYDIESGDFRAIEFSQCTGQWSEGKVTTVHHKKIILYKDMTVHVFVMNCPLDSSTVGFLKPYASSAEEVENAIKCLHKLEVCEGCVLPVTFNSTNKPFTFKDPLGTVRHVNCSLILDSSAKQQSRNCHECKRKNNHPIVLKSNPQKRKEKLKISTR